MASKIGNRDLLMATAKRLQPEGVRQFPLLLNTDQVQVVTSLDSGGFFDRISQSGGSSNNSTAGFASFRVPLVGLQSGTNLVIMPTNNSLGPTLDTRLLTSQIILTFDAAGALAFNGKAISLKLQLREQPDGSGTGVSQIQDLSPWVTVITTRLSYVWALSGHRNGLEAYISGPGPIWVPAERGLEIQVIVDDGTVLPANTIVSSTAMAQQQPSGNQLPL